MGWNLDQIMALNSDEGLPSYTVKYALMWREPAKQGFVSDDQPPIEDFVANRAALGVPIYEKAWRLYSILFMHGMIFKPGALSENTTVVQHNWQLGLLANLTDKDQI